MRPSAFLDVGCMLYALSPSHRLASINQTKCLGNAISADSVLAKLEARLAAAKQAMAQRKQLPTHRP
jgi:hypothetical protein